MKESIVRSSSIDQTQLACQKLRTRSVLRSMTPDIRSVRPVEKLESPRVKKPELLQYDHKNRVANMPLIGQVYLAREEFHLVEPNCLNAPLPNKETYSKLSIKGPKLMKGFIKEFNSLFSNRKNYFKSLQKSLKDLKTLNISKDDMVDFKNVIHSKPYQDPKSTNFFKAVKSGNLLAVRSMIRENPLIVQSFDVVGLTALHWCAIRSRIEIAQLLVNSHAIVDAIDMVKRTPLLIAVKRCNFDLIKFFLINKADPTLVPDSKKTIVDYTNKYVIQEFLKKGIMIYKQYLKLPQGVRDERWKNEFALRFHNFDSIKPKDLNLVKLKL